MFCIHFHIDLYAFNGAIHDGRANDSLSNAIEVMRHMSDVGRLLGIATSVDITVAERTTHPKFGFIQYTDRVRVSTETIGKDRETSWILVYKYTGK